MIATASELFEGRHYPGVVALCTDALDSEPECVPLLLLRARSHINLRRDLEAQADLRDVIRIEPACAAAFRLLGVLAARRDENESACLFFREALRLDPDDREAADWLLIADASLRPAAAVQKLPAPAASAGRFHGEPRRTSPAGSLERQLMPPRRSSGAMDPRVQSSQPRFARGTRQPDVDQLGDYEEKTKPFAHGSTPPALRVPAVLPPAESFDAAPRRAHERTADLPEEVIPLVNQKYGEAATIRGRPYAEQPPAKQAPRLSTRPVTRSAVPELPGFGEYLVSAGILTRDRLRAAQAYQRSMKVQLSTAIVTLGLATPQRIEWASVAHQTQLARGQQPQ